MIAACSGKVAHTAAKAFEVARRTRGRPYRCKTCRAWHLSGS